MLHLQRTLGNRGVAQLVQAKRVTAEGKLAGLQPKLMVGRNSPLVYGEKLNKDLGVYIQDSWRLNRLTMNLGIRWETLNSSVMAGESPAGRFVPERTFAEVKDVPDWNDFAPRWAWSMTCSATARPRSSTR